MCLKVTTILQYVVTFRHISLLCYWVSASCGDLFGGKESLNVVFSCAMSLVMKFVD
jgi:hypothetical protein